MFYAKMPYTTHNGFETGGKEVLSRVYHVVSHHARHIKSKAKSWTL